MCYIRHYNKFWKWYHFTRLQTQKLLFRSPGASSTTVCCTQPSNTSIRRCFSLSISFTGSGIHATVHNPKCFSCVVWCMVALFWLKIRSLTLQIIRCCTSCSWRSAIPFSSRSVVVFINTFKNYPELFLYFFLRKIHEHSLRFVTFKFLLNFY